MLSSPASAITRAAVSAPRRLLRCARAVARAAMIVVWTLASICVQAVLIAIPGRAKVVFARAYWAGVCGLLGMQVRVLGHEAGRATGRPVIYVSNHSSWIDVVVLGGRLRGCFVSKSDVAGWPLVGTVARLGRTVFVSRNRAATATEKLDMTARLRAGDNLILFPEGTSSDGSRVLPFHSTFFAMAKPTAGRDLVDASANGPLIQPISLVYDRLAGMPVGRAGRSNFSWFGDMDLARHFWRLAQWRGMRATLLLHEPLDPADFASRKELAAAAWETVAAGAATLRQNRPACPLSPSATPFRVGGVHTAVAA
jgi:1-acyl-sn-glycerol-3-phosphate acyltransferase